MSSYYEIYNQRLNRYGNDYQSRITGQRQKVFEQLLFKSIYRIEFMYGEEYEAAILEPYKQNDTETLHYLLTRVDVELAPGTIIDVEDEKGNCAHWMVYYIEHRQNKGYNKYIMLRMSHFITWEDREGIERETWGYFCGKQRTTIQDIVESRENSSVYIEDQNINLLIIPRNDFLRKDDYFEINTGDLIEGYSVTGYDRISTEGVEYVSVESDYIKDKSPIPEQKPGESSEDFYWFTGGEE